MNQWCHFGLTKPRIAGGKALGDREREREIDLGLVDSGQDRAERTQAEKDANERERGGHARHKQRETGEKRLPPPTPQ